MANYRVGVQRDDRIEYIYVNSSNTSIFQILNKYYRCPKKVNELIKDDIFKLSKNVGECLRDDIGYIPYRYTEDYHKFLFFDKRLILAVFLFKNGTWYVSQYGKTFLLSDFLNDASIHWDNLMQRHGKCKHCEKESELRANVCKECFRNPFANFCEKCGRHLEGICYPYWCGPCCVL